MSHSSIQGLNLLLSRLDAAVLSASDKFVGAEERLGEDNNLEEVSFDRRESECWVHCHAPIK